MRRLRKRIMTTIIDKTGRLHQDTIFPSRVLSCVTSSPWTGTHFAIVIFSGAEWIPLQDIPIRHLHHPLICNPRLEAQPRIHRLLIPLVIDTKSAVYRFVNASTESATTEARKNSTFPWPGAQRQTKLDDHSHLWEYKVLAEVADILETFLEYEDVGVQWVDLSNPTVIFIPLQAKPRKAGGVQPASRDPRIYPMRSQRAWTKKLVTT